MKRPQPDISDILKQGYIATAGGARKFKRLWGTTYVDGVEVLHNRRYYYPASSRPANFKQLFEYLGAYQDVTSANMKGISSAWIYLNKNKASDLPQIPNTPLGENYRDFIAANLNAMWWNPNDGPRPDNLTLTTSIVIDTKQDTSILDSTMAIATLINTIKNNYETIWNTYSVSQEGVGVISKGTYTEPVTSTELPDEDDLSPNDPYLETLARNILRDPSIPCTVKSVEFGLGETGPSFYFYEFTDIVKTPEELTSRFITKVGFAPEDNFVFTQKILNSEDSYTVKFDGSNWVDYTSNTLLEVFYTYVVTLEIPYYMFSTDDTLVSLVEADLTAKTNTTSTARGTPNSVVTRRTIRAMSSADLENDPELVSRVYRLWEDEAVLVPNMIDEGSVTDFFYAGIKPSYATLTSANNIWHYSASTGQWYLKADVFKNPRQYGMTFKMLSSYFSELIDSGYKKKKVPWYKKAIAIIVFVVAVVLAPVTGGATAGIAAFASAVLFASLVLTLLIIASSALGSESWASAFAWASKTLEPLILVATVIAIVTGISAAIEKAKEAAAEQLKKEVAELTLSEIASSFIDVVADQIIGGVSKGATDFVSGQVTKASLKFTASMLKLVNVAQNIKLKDLQERINDLKTQNEDLLAEMQQETDVLEGFARISASPATADWSIYASLFDHPYERGGGKLALGNVQRTTKQAIRRADYDDPVFDNILVV